MRNFFILICVVLLSLTAFTACSPIDANVQKSRDFDKLYDSWSLKSLPMEDIGNLKSIRLSFMDYYNNTTAITYIFDSPNSYKEDLAYYMDYLEKYHEDIRWNIKSDSANLYEFSMDNVDDITFTINRENDYDYDIIVTMPYASGEKCTEYINNYYSNDTINMYSALKYNNFYIVDIRYRKADNDTLSVEYNWYKELNKNYIEETINYMDGVYSSNTDFIVEELDINDYMITITDTDNKYEFEKMVVMIDDASAMVFITH